LAPQDCHGRIVAGKTSTTARDRVCRGGHAIIGGQPPSAYGLRRRGIERHGHAVAEVLHYRVQTANGERLLIVHLDHDGLITDYDLVNR
jgi:hypothetical protein